MADCKEITDELDDSHPPVVMKYDAAEESGENSTNGEKELRSMDHSRRKDTSSLPEPGPKIHCPVLTASKFGNSFGVSQFSNPTVKTKPTLLRPSQLSAIANNPGPSAKTVLQPAKFRNPFAKPPERTVTEGDDSARSNEANHASKETESEEKLTDSGKPKFLPLGSTTKENENGVDSTMTPSASTPSFVFGQNLKERVTVGCDADSSDNSEKEDAKSEESNENGSPELMFSNAATVCRSTSRPGLTLSQAAQEMEEASRANKRKYSQVTLLTGEEGETNVHQIDCKLFAFDKATRGWQERGRGTLRLNDREEESRLVGRAAGTQRLLLNTKVWPGMTAERAGPKSLRLTAMDVHGDVRIFIVQAAPKEVDQLHGLLMQRLKRAQERQPKKLATDH